MNLQKLKEAEAEFLRRYPGGFENPEMVEIGKKHRVPKMSEFAHESFAPEKFHNVDQTLAAMVSAVSRSSMVSMFEKPRFKDFVKVLDDTEKEALTSALYEQLHGDQQRGFELMVGMLQSNKVAKWTLMTIIPFYYKPKDEVFVKPMTTKGVIKTLDLDLAYKPLPSWDFYRRYRDIIGELKDKVDPSLTISNAAFTGFMMMSM